jgi:Leucine-rich repeat (LRR) protein
MCTKLTSLTFGYDFNQKITALEKCINLTDLTLGRKFNQDITALGKCINLTKLKLFSVLNEIEILSKYDLSNSLLQIDFSNFKLIPLKDCTNLTYLYHDYHHDNNIQVIKFLKYYKSMGL